MPEKNLEGKLRAIQDLKREKYVGTQTAWNYIKRVNNLYDNPEKVSKAINERLEEQGTVHYLATPEKIVGLGYYFPRFLVKANFENYDDSKGDTYELTVEDEADDKLGKTPLFSCIDLITDKRDDLNVEKLVDYLIPLFLDSQSKDMTNENFATKAIQYSDHIYGIDEAVRKEVFVKVSSSNWDQLLSVENYRTLESEIKRGIFFDEIKINSRIKLMINDQIDHRLEYRREILTDFIDSMINEEFFGDSYEASYDGLRDYNLRYLRESRERLKEFIERNDPKVIIDGEKSIIEKREFLLLIIAPERNFINKYLKN